MNPKKKNLKKKKKKSFALENIEKLEEQAFEKLNKKEELGEPINQQHDN